MTGAPRPAPPVFAPVSGRRAFDDIIDQLREQLRTDELKPGDRLPSERLMAEQFKVSRNTVREALRMLEISGLVEIRKGAAGGGFISQPDPQLVARTLSDMLTLSAFSLADLMEVWVALSTAIACAACERATDADFAALEENVALATELTKEERWEERALVNHAFLGLLAQATANPVFILFQNSITEMVRDIVSVLGPMHGDGILKSRRRLLKHLRNRDVSAAAQEMESHLKRVHAAWLGQRHIRGYE